MVKSESTLGHSWAMTSVTSCALSSPLILTWVPTAHSGLLQTFALLDPCISGTCVVSRMCAVSVIVDIALFLSSEARLYHLDEGLLRLCIRLTRNLCSLLVSKADLGSKDPPFQLAYMLFQRYPLPIRTRSWHRYKDVAPTLGKAG